MTKKRGVVFCVAFILFALCGVLQASANETNYRVKLHHYPKSGAFLVNNELTVLEMGSVVGFNIVKSSNGEETFLTEEELKEYEWELDMDKNSPAGYCMTYTGRQNDGVLSVYIPLGNVGKVTITGKHDDTLHNVQTTFSVTDYDMYQGGKVLKGTLHWDLDGWLRLAEMSNVQWDADQRHYVAVMDEFPWALPRNGTNFVGWEIDEGDSSRIVQPGETVIFEGRPSATAVFKRFFGWEQDEYGWKYYQGEPLRSTWDQAGDKWYYFGDDAYMKTGWLSWKGNWYYLWNSGAMATGWAWDRGYWYYLKGDGRMATGWLQDGDRWYYLKADGRMATGWQQYKNRWYFLNEDGSMKTGWLYWKGQWYHLSQNGRMSVSTTVDGYRLDATGVWRR